MPSACDDAAILCVGLIALAVLVALVIVGGARRRAHAIVQAAEHEALAIRQKARDDAVALNRATIALWRKAETLLRVGAK